MLYIVNSSSFAYSSQLAVPYLREVHITENNHTILSEDVWSYNINGFEYFKLRDVGKLLNFDIDYSGEIINIDLSKTSKDTINSKINFDEIKQVDIKKQNFRINGKDLGQLNSYNIDGYNYVSLREISEDIGFVCEWKEGEKIIEIEINPDQVEENFIQIEEKYNFEFKDADNFKKFLGKYIDGFKYDLFEIASVYNTVAGKNFYRIVFNAQTEEFYLPYTVIVYVENDNVEFQTNFDMKDIENVKIITERIKSIDIENEIKRAKYEAAKEINQSCICNQEIAKAVDNNLDFVLVVKTTCKDEDGNGLYVAEYNYKIG